MICATCVSGTLLETQLPQHAGARGEGTAPRTNSMTPQKQSVTSCPLLPAQVTSEKWAELCIQNGLGVVTLPGQGKPGA